MILSSYEGKNVEITVSSQCTHALFVEKGVITNIVAYGQENIFIELDNNSIINTRYIIKLVIKD